MNTEQRRELSRMKKLIKEGHRRFEQRKDRDYLEELLELGITEEEAWNIILQLNENSFFIDPKPNYSKDEDALIFKRLVNGMNVYIKIKIEYRDMKEETVCLSFHKDERRRLK